MNFAQFTEYKLRKVLGDFRALNPDVYGYESGSAERGMGMGVSFEFNV